MQGRACESWQKAEGATVLDMEGLEPVAALSPTADRVNLADRKGADRRGLIEGLVFVRAIALTENGLACLRLVLV